MGKHKHHKKHQMEEIKPTRNFLYYPFIIGVAAIYTGILVTIYNKINEVQPIPYLDEIYHVPQAEAYCKGNFSHWDKRITTLPGLYLLSISVITPISDWLEADFCETHHLRFTNVVLGVINFFIYLWLTQNIHLSIKDPSGLKMILSSLNMSLFPPLFFFTFLYYTDMAAVSLVLLMLAFHLSNRNICAALIGAVAILVRQTSIVWILLLVVGCIERVFNESILTPEDRKPEISATWRQLQVFIARFIRLRPIWRWLVIFWKLYSALFPYILVGLAFVAFLVINDGIVVGDRTAHQATIHVPQLFYMFGLVVAFGAPHWINMIRPFLASSLRRWYLVVVAFGVMGFVIRYNTLVHPYLLADNRHYVFYIWKRIFEYHALGRYLVMPAYIFGAYVTCQTLVKSRSFLFTCAMLICCTAALVPQRLLEIRYFFIPFLLIRLHVPPRNALALVIEFAMFVVINAVAFYLFITRPFYWADSPLVQRFMW